MRYTDGGGNVKVLMELNNPFPLAWDESVDREYSRIVYNSKLWNLHGREASCFGDAHVIKQHNTCYSNSLQIHSFEAFTEDIIN